MKKCIRIISAIIVLSVCMTFLSSCNSSVNTTSGPDITETAFILNVDGKEILDLTLKGLSRKNIKISDDEAALSINDNIYIINDVTMSLSGDDTCLVDIYNCDIAGFGVKNKEIPKESVYAVNKLVFTNDKINNTEVSVNGVTFGSTTQDILDFLGDGYTTISGALELSSFPTSIYYDDGFVRLTLSLVNGQVFAITYELSNAIPAYDEKYAYSVTLDSNDDDNYVTYQYLFNFNDNIYVDEIEANDSSVYYLHLIGDIQTYKSINGSSFELVGVGDVVVPFGAPGVFPIESSWYDFKIPLYKNGVKTDDFYTTY